MNHHQIKLKLFNTEARMKEEVTPSQDNLILLYTCGPTVYNFAHIGNFRAYVFEDLLRRSLKFFGMQVKQVMNITDIEDKIIKGAIEKGISLKEFTDLYTQAFFEDLKTLNIESVEFYPKATEFLPDMIQMIQTLLEKGFAYQGQDKSIYYSIRKFHSYGRLSHLHLDELQEGASDRVCTDEYNKENASDFALWKAYDPERDGKIFWESPFGRGRPGWHIECSAMATKLLGESIDIHVGGVDNMFPHHENEIAQSEACFDKRFVRIWLHCEHLLVDNKKMSKSLGNFFTLRDLLQKGYSGRQIRYMLLQTHYRTQLNFSFEGLNAVEATLQRLEDFVERLKQVTEGDTSFDVNPIIEEALKGFAEALADDLNISVALAALFDFVRKINHLCDEKKISKQVADQLLNFLKELDQVIGVIPFEKEALSIPEELILALQKREEARKSKNWLEADKQRDFIHSKGYVIEDTPAGSRLKKTMTS